MVFVPDPTAPVVGADDARHLLDVLRLRPGEPVIAGDGVGTWVPCVVAAGTSGRRGRAEPASVLVAEGEPVTEPLPRPSLTVAFAPVKGDRPEWVVQKLTEVGVDHIVPIHTRRSVVRWEGERAARVVDRLRRVALEASAQCRRPHLPEVSPVRTVRELAELGRETGHRVALAHPGGRRPDGGLQVVAIGPEGGWADEEVEGAGDLVGLGPTVLRAETAAVVAGTLLCSLRSALIAPLA
jgi:16S rRNA (uracil1498-N3)-methyltransferase